MSKLKKEFETVCLQLADYRNHLDVYIVIPDLVEIIQDFLVDEAEFESELAKFVKKQKAVNTLMAVSRRITRLLNHTRNFFLARWWKTLDVFIDHHQKRYKWFRIAQDEIVGTFFGVLIDPNCNRPWCWCHAMKMPSQCNCIKPIRNF